MVCSCMIPMPNFPTNCEWGPILWRLLHGLADKYGRLMSPLYAKEESIAWPLLIIETQKILPCKDCRENYKQYLSLHNPLILKTLTPDEQKIWVQTFFWDLHNKKNLENNKPIIPFDQLHSLYKDENFLFDLKHFEKLLGVVFRYNEVSLFSWRNWLKQFKTIQSIYGLF